MSPWRCEWVPGGGAGISGVIWSYLEYPEVYLLINTYLSTLGYAHTLEVIMGSTNDSTPDLSNIEYW